MFDISFANKIVKAYTDHCRELCTELAIPQTAFDILMFLANHPEYRIKYNRIKKRRGHKKAIIAVARMILVTVYHILSTGEVYNPCDMEQVINPIPVKKVMTIENAIEFLNSQGFDTSSLILSQS